MTPLRCMPRDLGAVLSPGMITGVYDGGHWIDWLNESDAELPLVRATTIARQRFVAPRFICVLDSPQDPSTGSSFGADLAYLVGQRRGIAIVSSRPGFLLRWSHRLLV
ncbi:MAG: hypothetical protein ABI679_14610, partial [Gemmatimonadota bacterium]